MNSRRGYLDGIIIALTVRQKTAIIEINVSIYPYKKMYIVTIIKLQDIHIMRLIYKTFIYIHSVTLF